MDFSIILSKLKNVKKKGKGYIAICPAHPDREASLSIWHDDSEGKTVMSCHAGCEIADILDAAGLIMSDLFDKPLPKGDYDNRFERIYQYKNSNGEVLFEKVRFKATEVKKKNFTQRRKIGNAVVWGLESGIHYETYPGSNEWTKNLGKKVNPLEREFEGCEPVIYNLPAILKAIAAGEEVHIAEGEKDADNLTALGFPCCCNFDGASASKLKPKWRKSYNEIFKDAKVVIFNDNDEPGITHADYIAQELHEVAEYVKRPELPGILDKEDITDFIQGGNGKEEIQEIINSTSIYEYDDAADRSLINFNFSDVGNAERLMAVYGKNIRYSPIRKNWFAWSGKCWEFDNTGKIESLSRKVIRKLQTEGEAISLEGLEYEAEKKKEKLKMQIKSFVLKSEGDGRLKAMTNQAKTFIPYILKETDQNVYLINYKNGTLDLHTGLLRKFDRKDYLTKIVNLEYDPMAKCPNWTEFVNKIFLEDQELINYIQKSIGYSMTGDANLQCFYILHGKGSNGKGTFIQAIERLLGAYYSTLSPESLMERTGNNEGAREDLAKLEGTRFVCVNECDENKYFDENLLKRMSSGSNEKFTVRRMYESYFDLRPEFKMWMTTNGLPRIKGTDKGIWRRIRKIPFEYDFDLDPTKDVNFYEEKLVPELSGILNWALEGCLKWQQEGMKVPKAVEVEIEKYKTDMDPIVRFIEDCCVVSETCRARIPALYDAYTEWCHENKEYVLSSIKFSKRLVDKGYKQSKVMGSRYWSGIGIADLSGQMEVSECKDNISPFWNEKE
ncbi:phage/plasmid primase, P4 family [Clostridium tagluense]|uniref:phage/plasmid primase, P4 family n=1 Tax=Clostridium tagluense TaxID=360422 RepID=UPI001C0AD53D|nr:phage/plasmid primase, P4 family [Clostridium tagluense]MBU3126766.1 hypothetical protein [Clostridium tagluense]